ncbi:MAG: glutamate 5-kinase [Hyphomicrobiaceae bacterium]
MPGQDVRPEWGAAKRIVVKIGSALLADRKTGTLNAGWLESVTDDISALVGEGRQVILVSSGAIALGRHTLGARDGELRLEENQAAAAVGQIALARAYSERFSRHGLNAAQILLTLGDTEERRRYLNARNTLTTLLDLGVVPVVNENDTVATSEIRYGDNDRLAARVASMVSADAVVLLSDVDGLYSAPPDTDPDARRIDIVRGITPEIEAMAGDAGTALSRGGMVTKVEAARIANQAGTHLVIASGKDLNPLNALARGGPCTWFLAEGDPVAARKRWIGGSLKPAGSVHVDSGAVAALRAGKSLLPAGIVQADGVFSRGDLVVIRDPDGVEVGRGLTAYDAGDVIKLLGKRSGEIPEILGYTGRSAIIHRDDMVIGSR